jgi:plasmid stability protein
MASITIRNLDQAIRARLRRRAARHDRSVEEEAREILRTALCVEPGPTCDLAAAIRRRLAPWGGVELPTPERDPMREPPGFNS